MLKFINNWINRNGKDKIIRAATVVGNTWQTNKVMPTGTDGPPIKLDLWFNDLIVISFLHKIQYKEWIQETPVFPLGIAALRRRKLGEKMVAGSIPLKGHFWELLNRLLNFWYWSDEFKKQTRTRKVTSTVRSYLYPVHRTPTDDPIYGGGNGPRWG